MSAVGLSWLVLLLAAILCSCNICFESVHLSGHTSKRTWASLRLRAVHTQSNTNAGCSSCWHVCCRSFFAHAGSLLRNDAQAGSGGMATCGRQVLAPQDVYFGAIPTLQQFNNGSLTFQYYNPLSGVSDAWPLISLKADPVLSDGVKARARCRTAPTSTNPQPCNNAWCGYTNVLRSQRPSSYRLNADTTDSPWAVAYPVNGVGPGVVLVSPSPLPS